MKTPRMISTVQPTVSSRVPVSGHCPRWRSARVVNLVAFPGFRFDGTGSGLGTTTIVATKPWGNHDHKPYDQRPKEKHL